MKSFNTTLIKLTFYVVTGIVIGFYFSFQLQTLLWSIGILLSITYLFSLLIKTSNKSYILGILLSLCFICIGILTSVSHDQSKFQNHYLNRVQLNEELSHSIQFRIREVLKPNRFYDKYVIDILNINDTSVIGKSLLNVNIDASKTTTRLQVDAIYYSNTEFKSLNPPLNPHQFNYKAYLEKQHIYHQIFATHNELFKLSETPHRLSGYAALLRQKINSKLNSFHFKSDELAIINALLLGQRQDISEDIYNSYSQAGVIHILAVSGLHVGIVLLLLNLLLKPLTYLKHGRAFKLIIIIICLWSFAIVAGLSASVTRAVTMFSIVAFAMNLKRPTNIYNTLIFSILILLLCRPSFIFDVGFQLSYLAVFAIVSIQPMLYKMWVPKYKILDFFWKIFSVTIAAQFGVIPLSLYYFHQFPGLFFISNLVIIPCLGLLLGFGILVILLALFGILPPFIAKSFGFLINLMNDFVTWISHQEAFVLKDISFSLIDVLVSYTLIIHILYVLRRPKYKHVVFLLITVACQVFYISKSFRVDNEFIIFHKSRYSMIGMKTNKHLEVHHNLNDPVLKVDRTLKNYTIGSHIANIQFDSLQPIYKVKNKTILVIDSLGLYQIPELKSDIILLRNSPKINLSRVIDELNPKTIICDGSNYKAYRERWAKTCQTKKRLFHDTSKKGAFILDF